MLRYTLIHKWYVLQFCWRLGIPFRGLLHDWSKFIPRIFRAYQRFFYGTFPDMAHVAVMVRKGEKVPKWHVASVKAAMDWAWNWHQKVEPHHWQHWVLLEDDNAHPRYLDIPFKVCAHMVADWAGASRMYNVDWFNGVLDWYMENRYRIRLHPRSRAAVEYLIGAWTDCVAKDELARRHYDALLAANFPRLLPGEEEMEKIKWMLKRT